MKKRLTGFVVFITGLWISGQAFAASMGSKVGIELTPAKGLPPIIPKPKPIIPKPPVVDPPKGPLAPIVGKLPQTGEMLSLGLFFIGVLMLILLMFLYYRKKQHVKKEVE